jgi:hypothetical protein
VFGFRTEVQESLFPLEAVKAMDLPPFTILQGHIGHDYSVFLWEPSSEDSLHSSVFGDATLGIENNALALCCIFNFGLVD